ncbi:FkbM family methyltransferase [Roseomonas haemaphysalidis]|jgi:FkbM family methyltransferase|uniref:FkbM family methyltransferase n=1 Tax=Roseomonas haemaphysalidis TaxID=2768162 RepID=A0ABS3KQZ9_9PROT|nr:FkbM family methyltransferase [Roseomonas haemaphysalidis]MBO1079875.1 FkbM family methyltransferase [Roseomonas haemaphysalidis]
MTDQDPAARISALESRIDLVEQRLGAKLDQISKRLEEITSFFASRTNRMLHAQSIYLGDNTALTFLETGQRVYVDTRSRDIGVHLLTFGRWESNYLKVFEQLVKPGHTVFDVGANHAFYALHAARLTGPTGRVEAFEPNPHLAGLATASLRTNGYTWAKLHQVAVGDTPGEAMLTFNPDMSGGGNIRSGAGQGKAETVSVKMAVLDQMFPDPSFTIDVIKMDVEGYEGKALRGMSKLLARSPNVRMMLEFAPRMMASAGVGAPEVVSQLQGLGLSAWLIDGQSKLTPISWDNLASQTDGLMNILVAREAPV